MFVGSYKVFFHYLVAWQHIQSKLQTILFHSLVKQRQGIILCKPDSRDEHYSSIKTSVH